MHAPLIAPFSVPRCLSGRSGGGHLGEDQDGAHPHLGVHEAHAVAHFAYKYACAVAIKNQDVRDLTVFLWRFSVGPLAGPGGQQLRAEVEKCLGFMLVRCAHVACVYGGDLRITNGARAEPTPAAIEVGSAEDVNTADVLSGWLAGDEGRDASVPFEAAAVLLLDPALSEP